nr:hypothetical protein [Marinicella sp. W31]MDC2877547.1 hypothetical protein [Marinicella sp. W31]
MITTDHAKFIEEFGRQNGCQSKREALMMIIEDVKERFEDEDDGGDQKQ